MKWLTIDRALLVAVLSIQAGMAGWFYRYYNTQQQPTQQQPQSSLQKPLASPRPVSFFSFSPRSTPNQAGVGRTTHTTPSGALLTPPTSFFGAPPDGFFSDADTLFADMQRRMQRNLAAFQRMHDALLSDDSWHGVGLVPAMDMREYDDHYEVAVGLPDAAPGEVQATLDGRVLTIQARHEDQQTNAWQRQSFQTRVMLPWPVAAQTVPITRFDQGTLIVEIPKASTAPGVASVPAAP